MMEYQVAEPYNGPSFGAKTTAFGTTGVNQQASSVQPTNVAFSEQTRQSLRAALAEIEELKQSQRCVEISLAKQIEENETLKGRLEKQEQATENVQEEHDKKVKDLEEANFQIEQLNRKIQGFSKNQENLSKKNEFKASNYMGEINERESELNAVRTRLLEQEEQMRVKTVTSQQLTSQRDYLVQQLKEMESQMNELQLKFDDQSRLLSSVVANKKNPAANLASVGEEGSNFDPQQRALEDAQRADRITRQMNRSNFMAIGENPPQLYSEQDPTQVRRVTIAQDNAGGSGGVFMDRNQSYLSDDSVPSGIYALIETYRMKAQNATPGHHLALLIDDFFGEAHAIMKDSHLREIARIRNENSVEITKLRKVIDGRSIGGQAGRKGGIGSADHHTAFKVQASFADNEVERQRRLLIEENETLKKRLRACENLLASGTEERKNFMQGASWVAKKAQIESDRHSSKIVMLINEFEKRTQSSLINQLVLEYDGKKVGNNKDWLKSELLREAGDLNKNYESLFENVNYQLSKAIQGLKN